MANILVVDDSKVIRQKLKIMFTQSGHNVVAEASNGHEAFLAYARFHPDLVTMDIMMPVVTGIDAVKKIIRKYPDAKIVMISSLGQKDKVLEAIKWGAKHFIVKPFTAEKANNIINRVLEN